MESRVPNAIAALIALLSALLVPSPPIRPPEPVIWRTFTATAYTADCYGCSGFTYTEMDVRHTQYDEYGRRVIAVDPDAISLGSEVIVRLADGYEFTAIAEDVGSAIKGARIDVLTESTERALGFGRQDVKIQIVKERDTNEND